VSSSTRRRAQSQRNAASSDVLGSRRWEVVSTEYGELVSEHEDLDVFGCIGSGE
jgi:hypothetical protein